MENYNNEIFGFGNEINEETEQVTNFNYDSISGLGESNYENEDLFNTEVENNQSFNNYSNEYDMEIFNGGETSNYIPVTEKEEPLNLYSELNQDFSQPEDLVSETVNDYRIGDLNTNIEEVVPVSENFTTQQYNVDEENLYNTINQESSEFGYQAEENSYDMNNSFEETKEESIQELYNVEAPIEENVIKPEENDYNINNNFEETEEELIQEAYNVETPEKEDIDQLQEPIELVEPEINQEESTETEGEVSEEINISNTPIEELNELTHYEVDSIEETDINSLFDKVSVNVKDASDIFRKNTDLKQKIDNRFEELKKLQSEIENSRKKQIDEINNYKEDVLSKLTEKKEEIEKRLNLLKESQAALEKEKKEFEDYKKKEQENIDNVQKEVQSAYDDRREELGRIEDVLRKQKDALDEERSQLALDKIQYESDKNELANNLLKFNEIVDSFTNGVNDIKG